MEKSRIYTAEDRLRLLEEEQFIVVDRPGEFISRITLNRPAKRNALNHEVRAQIFNQLQLNDQDVSILNSLVIFPVDNKLISYISL